MSLTGIASIDSTIHKTQRWIAEVSDGMGLLDRERSLAGLRSTLHVVRDHLPLQAAVALGAQLPLLVRGMYFENWRPSASHDKPHTKGEVVTLIAADLPWAGEVDVEKLARTVLEVLSRHVDPGEVSKLVHLLPKGLRELWAQGHA